MLALSVEKGNETRYPVKASERAKKQMFGKSHD